MNKLVKRTVTIFLFLSFIIPRLVLSQNLNEAIEPVVEGSAVIDLLKGGALDAWQVPSDRWRLIGNVIIVEVENEVLTTAEWLYTKQRFSNFEFTCEVKLTGDNRRNSGVYFRVNKFLFTNKKGNKSYEAPSGYEYDIAFHRSGKKNFRGSLGDWYARPALRIFTDQKIINQVYKPEEWNRLTIRANGNRVEYWMNGMKILDYLDNDPNASDNGYIGFQIHDGSIMKVAYRNVRVLPLGM